MGRKKRPFYRLVAIDSRKRRDGLEIERLGWYNPIHKDLSYSKKISYLDKIYFSMPTTGHA